MSRTSDMSHLQHRAWATAEEKGFHDRTVTSQMGDLHVSIALMHSELSEAVEDLRNREGAIEIPFFIQENGKPDGWAVELADVVIRVMDTLACFSIELDELIEWKLDYNATRPWMHGGKAT